ncbi:MAG TPA: FAD-dependent oxidoreductase [Jiangellaceae bacterium]|nr:FAD-dependent oxidoreductase [Jiangellaceae bacterium]
MKTAIVVGSGAGGATVAKELQGAYQVIVLEEGRPFHRATTDWTTIDRLRRSRLLVDERLLRVGMPAIRIRKTPDMVLVNAAATGGTTTIATGNGMRLDGGLRTIGVNLDPEFAEIAREVPITTSHDRGWRETTRRLFDVVAALGLEPFPTPKMATSDDCRHCGRCVFGCPFGIKWDTRAFLDEAVNHGAELVTGARVDRIVIEGDRATGVLVGGPLGARFRPADLVVVAAGGFGTPAILERSGIASEPNLFVDPVLTVAARLPEAWQYNEIAMPFVVHRPDYILSPYFDWISALFNPAWRHPLSDIVGVMIKLTDEGTGSVSARGRIKKSLTATDRARLEDGVGVATEVLMRLGADPASVFRGTINAGHPGGTLPLTEATASTFHDERLPDNVYVADGSLFPRSLGGPPILTTIAIAKRVASLCRANVVGKRSAGGYPS